MRRLAVLATIIVLMTCTCTIAMATTYYVAMDGSDSWPGTEAQPWATLQHAISSIASGDTIIVKQGTYVGCRINQTYSVSGTPGNPCVLKAEEGASVLISGPGPDNRHDSSIELEGLDGVEMTDWVIEGFEITGGGYAGIDVRVGRRHELRSNYCHDNDSIGIFMAFAYYPTLEYNECSYNASSHGIYLSNSGDYATVVGNFSHHNGKAGVQFNGDERYKPGDGVMSFNTIEDNVIWENALSSGSGAFNFDGMSDSIVRNNLLYDNHSMGITLFAIDGGEGSSRNKIYNNTIVMAPNSYQVIRIPSSKGQTPDPTDNLVKNNILYTPDSSDICIMLWDPSALVAGGSDYNSVTNTFSVDNGKNTITLAQWQSYGFDAHSFVATPSELFVDPDNDDYYLKTGSPAINAGTTLSEVTDDIEGTSRPQGSAYDIGCYEATSGPVPPVAEFSGNPLSGPPTLTVNFTDLSSGSPTSWDWSFGDSGTSQAQHPSHDYTGVGDYTVSLTAYNPQGQDTETKPDYISVSNQTCHVGAIDLVGLYRSTGKPSGRGYYAEATITVHDQDCQALSGVTVDITWSGCVSGTDSDMTDGSGQVVFESPVNPDGGTFTCCVDNLTKDGYPYSSGDNHETCDSIQNP